MGGFYVDNASFNLGSDSNYISGDKDGITIKTTDFTLSSSKFYFSNVPKDIRFETENPNVFLSTTQSIF
jgi:hypothetical protein